MTQVNITGQIVITNSPTRNILSLQYSLVPAGSNNIVNTANITTGTWQTIDQGSNGDFRLGYFYNSSTTSSVKIAIGGTTDYAAWLQPGDYCILPNSGSATIYAQAYGAESPMVLQYFLTEQ